MSERTNLSYLYSFCLISCLKIVTNLQTKLSREKISDNKVNILKKNFASDKSLIKELNWIMTIFIFEYSIKFILA
jgi:hypothetical protein